MESEREAGRGSRKESPGKMAEEREAERKEGNKRWGTEGEDCGEREAGRGVGSWRVGDG